MTINIMTKTQLVEQFKNELKAQENGKELYTQYMDIVLPCLDKLAEGKLMIESGEKTRMIIGAQMIIAINNSLADLSLAVSERSTEYKVTVGSFLGKLAKEQLLPLATEVLKGFASKIAEKAMEGIGKI